MAIEAVDELQKEGITADLLSLSSIKPIDEVMLIESVKKTERILTIEELSIIGGMGSAVAEVIGKLYPVPVQMIGIEDVFSGTGPYGF